MTEEYNPYSRPQQPYYPETAQQQPYYPETAQPQPEDRNIPPQSTAVPIQPMQPQYPQQSFTNNPRPVPRRTETGAAARAFGMVSFILGCFVLPVTSMIYFNFRSSVSEKFSASMSNILLFCIPALVFGVISLMKKTDKKLFPILGIAFAGVLMLCAFITYFFMVNTAPVR